MIDTQQYRDIYKPRNRLDVILMTVAVVMLVMVIISSMPAGNWAAISGAALSAFLLFMLEVQRAVSIRAVHRLCDRIDQLERDGVVIPSEEFQRRVRLFDEP